MQMSIRRAQERGHADHGWLDSHHTFSFASYHDPRFLGFGPLRVINQDRVAPGRGFGQHPHRDMEIISYVVEGQLAHRDSMGTGSVIQPGEVQIMSAGTGVVHSEMNASREAPVHFLQIWIQPDRLRIPPRYGQQAFPTTERGLRLVVSGDGREGSLRIQQDADLYRLLLSAEEGTLSHALRPGRRAWLQVIHGNLEANGALLFPGDGLSIAEADTVRLQAHSADRPVEALLFDLP